MRCAARSSTETTPIDRAIDSAIVVRAERLEQALGTPVKIKPAGAGGQIVIDYYSGEELARLVDQIKGER